MKKPTAQGQVAQLLTGRIHPKEKIWFKSEIEEAKNVTQLSSGMNDGLYHQPSVSTCKQSRLKNK